MATEGGLHHHRLAIHVLQHHLTQRLQRLRSVLAKKDASEAEPSRLAQVDLRHQRLRRDHRSQQPLT